MFWPRSFLLTFLFFVTISEIYAQTYIEIRGGYTRNQLSQDFKSITFEDIEASGGGYVAMVFTYYVNKRLFFKLGSEWVQKRYRLRRVSPFNAVYKQINNHYLQLPVSIGLPLISTKKTRFTLSSGVSGGYWLSSSIKGTIPNAFDTFTTIENEEMVQNFRVSEYSTRNNLDRDNYTRLEFGLLFESDVIYTINSTWSLSIRIGYQHALISQQKKSHDNGSSIVNRTLVMSTGVMYQLH
ncbi:PorT family protein [Fulvivirga sp. M361]|uniref:outer membrane beta-barrel protein n=1 Tax=Fulvivirga sp. M361 TaxID=2594266 RepID=UPI00117A1496|nr:outer membrane beta-barrel protein [Fulvivirga sp. M361]TRX54829.1 PorT family protein [Fulvivirga sp. M361]